MVINKDIIYIDMEFDDKEELLRKLSDMLYQQDYVRDSFKDAIMARERIFPTGLPTVGVKVALPHTDPIHVKKPGILVATLKKPIKFKEMGNGLEDIDVEMVFMLAVKDPSAQIELLQKLMNIFSKEEILKSIKESKDKDVICDILTSEVYSTSIT